MNTKNVLFFLLGALVLFTVRAEDEAEGESKEAQPVEEETNKVVGPSKDAQVSFFFVQPAGGKELPAGKVATFLVGFVNKGEKDFKIHFVEPSFRYPFDFSASILNLTYARYEKTVAPKQEATFDYRFIPNEAFIGRPLGFVVNLHYTDSAGGYYINTVYNETITVEEDESQFNAETGSLVLLFAGFVALIGFLVYQYLSSKLTRKAPAVTKQARYEVGTNKDEIDYEWIPRAHLNSEKSPKLGSPRNRRVQKAK